MKTDFENFRMADLKNAQDYAQIENALRKVLLKNPNQPWKIIDILVRLYHGELGAVVSKSNFTDMGIFHLKVPLYETETQLWIHVAYSEQSDGITDYMPDWLELAKDTGATTIGFDSQRPGYLKRVPKIDNAEISRIEYRIGIN